MSELPTRRAGDHEKAQRTVTGWIGIAMAVVGFGAGLAWENVYVLGAAFLAAMASGNRLPFESLPKFLPWGKG
jgi:hypothetical protein